MGFENLKPGEVSIVFMAVVGVFGVVKSLLEIVKSWGDKRFSNQAPAQPAIRCSDALSSVIAGNTQAIQENTKSNQELQTVIRVSLAEQGAKLDELLRGKTK